MAQLNDLIVAGASRLLNGLGVLGSANMDSILPNITETYSLGSNDKRWNLLYAKTLNIYQETADILTVNTKATIGNGAGSTSATTGSLIVKGGIGVNANSYFGGTITSSKFIGPLQGNATTSSYPYGFSSYETNATWGNQTGTTNVCWNDSSGGSIDWRRDNPSSGKVSMKIDGRVYVNEGSTPVATLTSTNGYWGMGNPDGGTSDWIRTTSNGILPYQSGGASSLGTSSWPFSAIYANSIYGTLNGNASSATLLKPTDNASTTTYNVGTWAANTSGGYIVWREAFKNSNLGSDTGDIVFWLNGSTTLNVTIDGNYYANHGDLVLTTGNYASNLDSRYVNTSGDSMNGPLQINTSLQNHSSPTAHCLVINSSGGTPTLANAPGIGFHIANVNWASLIFDTSGFRFLNSSFDGYVPVFCSTLYGTAKDVANASYRTTDGGANYILIKINNSTHYMTMFTVRVYQGYTAYDITFSGYQYGTNYWYSPQATLSNSTTTGITVYFGYNSENEMWVALPGASYTGAKVINVINGYQPLDMVNAFSITRVSSLPGTIQSTQTIYRPWHRGEAVTGAVWNDYAECRESDTEDLGYVLMETGKDSLTKTTERLSHFAGVSSDTWGFSQGETEKAKTPIAVAGRVLVYPYQDRNNYKPGDCVCAAPGGTVDIMTREEVILWPDRIVGTVSQVPDYDEWGGGEMSDRDSVKVNGRIWIKVR